MSQRSPLIDAPPRESVLMDEMTIELGLGRIDYVMRLVIAALGRDPYLRAPVTDGLPWPQLRAMVQELANRRLDRHGAAAQEWAELGVSIAAARASADDFSTDRAELGRHLSDLGTQLLHVLHLMNTELGATR